MNQQFPIPHSYFNLNASLRNLLNLISIQKHDNIKLGLLITLWKFLDLIKKPNIHFLNFSRICTLFFSNTFKFSMWPPVPFILSCIFKSRRFIHIWNTVCTCLCIHLSSESNIMKYVDFSRKVLQKLLTNTSLWSVLACFTEKLLKLQLCLIHFIKLLLKIFSIK